MKHSQEQLEKLEAALLQKDEICSSRGAVDDFPPVLYQPFRMVGIGIIVCSKGCFSFSVMKEKYDVHQGETVILPEDAIFCVSDKSEDLEAHILFYSVEPIRDLLGNLVQQMQLYVKISPVVYYVWKTHEEEDLIRYMSLLGKTIKPEDNLFLLYEQRLLLLSLTYRLCSISQRKFLSKDSVSQRRTEIFLRLIGLIDHYYLLERGVSFYADKLCLSPKYLSELSKSVCGYTVQELVFKSIIRRCMTLLKGSTKTVQEIAEECNFPNPSSFGTFFKKQTGLSPYKYRVMNRGKIDIK